MLPPLLPLPNEVVPGNGVYSLNRSSAIATPPALRKQCSDLISSLDLKVAAKGSSGSIRLNSKLKDQLGEEGYELNVNSEGVRLVASSVEGARHGLKTLAQLARPSKSGLDIPYVSIKDRPRYRWRGFMLDSSRHFWSVKKIEQYIDLMSQYKLNVFHWHLTDDQGWRLEIKKYPRLQSISAWRSKSMPSDPDGGPRYGGYYTQEEVRRIVRFAAKRKVTVVPEIEMPGHSVAVLAAYPSLSCTEKTFQVMTQWGVSDDIVCAGKDRSFQFYENVLKEVIQLFPSKIIHVGGDEAPKKRWNECPKCQARIKAEGLKDSHELQSYFIQRIERFLNARGRKLIGWDEILEGGLAPRASVMSWRGKEGGIAAAKSGHDAVMSPTSHCYLDYFQGDPKNEPAAFGGSRLTLETVYSHNPTPAELSEKEAKHIIGVQGNMWTEQVQTESHLDYMVFPRVLAIAEVGWTNQELRTFPDFRQRLSGRLPHLDQLGINYRKLDPLTP